MLEGGQSLEPEPRVGTHFPYTEFREDGSQHNHRMDGTIVTKGGKVVEWLCSECQKPMRLVNGKPVAWKNFRVQREICGNCGRDL